MPLLGDEVTTLNYFTTSRSQASSKAIALGMKSVTLYSKARDIDLKAFASRINKLREKIRTYHPDNVYNMDKTRLMLKYLPNCSYIKKSEVKTA